MQPNVYARYANASPPFGGIFDYDSKHARLQEVVLLMEDATLWQDPPQAKKLGAERAELERVVQGLEELHADLRDAETLLALATAEGDAETIQAVGHDLDAAEGRLHQMEVRRMFSGATDAHNAFVDIQAGSGGTEAQDWAQMLVRMYTRWAEAQDFAVATVAYSPGEVAGVKSATLKICGEYVYGNMRTETGVHRLVRKSPFDSGHRRHTSFASVYAYPEIDERVELTINPADLRIDTYRASGAGGQHVNRTDSAVRITHNPSGIVVQCQNNRSQHRNKAEAMTVLKARLYEAEMQARRHQQQTEEDNKAEIGWGQQIRSYVLDQSRIKDLRTGLEIGNTQAVLDGDLNPFIEASLKSGIQ